MTVIKWNIDKKYVKPNNLDREINVEIIDRKKFWTIEYCLLFVIALFTFSFILIYIYKDLMFVRRSVIEICEPESHETYAVPHQYTDTALEKVVSCYYNTPTPDGLNQLMPNNIHPYLCTHINVAFARVVNKQIALEDIQYKTLVQLQQLKKKNPKLKILLSVGGSGNGSGFSEMVVDHASRKIFIKSIKYILRNYTLDGIDLDWEFPALHSSLTLRKRERQHFSQLLQEIRREYVREKRTYLLTVAVAAQQSIVDVSYDVNQLNLYTDFINIMTYDYHFYSKYTPFTGLNSPLFARSDEQLFMSSLNINYTVHMYLDKGLEKSKIVIGIPTYGHTFSLVNAKNTKIGSPASSYGSIGSKGFINYPDICSFISTSKNDVTVKQDNEAKVPFLYKDSDWVSYDSPKSVIDKAIYIKDYGLRGAMVYSLNADDYEGVCGGDQGEDVKFPLLQSVTSVLLKNFTNNNVEKGDYL